jgi:hypothetical protein
MIILTAYMSGVSVPLIVLFGLPTSIAAAITGYVIGFRKVDSSPSQKESTGKRSIGKVLLLLSPIIVSIILNVVAGLKTYVAVAVGLVILILISKSSLKTISSTIKKAHLPNMVFSTVAAMIFRSVIVSSQLPETVSLLMQGASVPWIILAIIVPLTLGVIGGTPITPIAISIPILSALSQLNPFTVALIYSFSVLGYVISPLHLCLVCTIEYFKVRAIDVYRSLIPAFLTVTAVTVLFAVLMPH